MKCPIIIVGPPACGKTHFAAELMAHYGLIGVCDDWSPGDAIQKGYLHLTSEGPTCADIEGRVRIIDFEDAAREADLTTYAALGTSYAAEQVRAQLPRAHVEKIRIPHNMYAAGDGVNHYLVSDGFGAELDGDRVEISPEAFDFIKASV